jgi:hypothetical protein
MYFKIFIVSVKEYYNPYNLIYLFMRKNMIILSREKKNYCIILLNILKKELKSMWCHVSMWLCTTTAKVNMCLVKIETNPTA